MICKVHRRNKMTNIFIWRLWSMCVCGAVSMPKKEEVNSPRPLLRLAFITIRNLQASVLSCHPRPLNWKVKRWIEVHQWRFDKTKWAILTLHSYRTKLRSISRRFTTENVVGSLQNTHKADSLGSGRTAHWKQNILLYHR